MSQVQGTREYVHRFFTPENAGSYDSVVRCATLGQDNAWKLRIANLVGTKSSVLELAAGTGVLTSMLSSAGISVTGLDLTFDYLAASTRKRNANVSALIQALAEILPYRDCQFDAVVSSYLAKYADIRVVVQECYRVLKPGGIAIFHDFTRPSGRLMLPLWNGYFHALQIIGLIVPSWKVVFHELGNVIAKSDWEKQLTTALERSGFINGTLRYYTRCTAAIVTAEKP